MDLVSFDTPEEHKLFAAIARQGQQKFLGIFSAPLKNSYFSAALTTYLSLALLLSNGHPQRRTRRAPQRRK